jgi:antirestriction protein ArdC
MNSQQIAELTTKAVEDLARALESGHSETLADYLRAIGRFHKYSLHNVLLIALQKPTATHVAGFHAWHKLGRHVRKGEKGITIFAPILRHKKEPEDEKQPIVEEVVLGYRTYAVFDVSQTEGKPLPSIGRVAGDPRHYGERLAAFTLSLGIRLEYSLSIAPARGVSEGGKITLLPDLDPAEYAAVLAHELAHEYLHHQPRRASTTKTVRETEAEAVAYVVSQAIGLETGTAAADYIQLHRGDAKLLLESLNYIRLAAGRILDGILEDHNLPEVQAAQISETVDSPERFESPF